VPNINPYLNFAGTCEEAFNFYKSVFGGDFRMVMRFKDTPPEVGAPAEHGEKIMHIALPIGKGNVLMGSDYVPGFGPPVQVGNNYGVAVGGDTEDEAKTIFEGLSAGGNVLCPFDKAFWGSLFGMAIDKFGIPWMVTYDENRQG
jgi:PhnB protein